MSACCLAKRDVLTEVRAEMGCQVVASGYDGGVRIVWWVAAPYLALGHSQLALDLLLLGEQLFVLTGQALKTLLEVPGLQLSSPQVVAMDLVLFPRAIWQGRERTF